MNNEYYICLKGSNSRIHIDLSKDVYDLERKTNISYYQLSYFFKIFEIIEKSSYTKGLIFYLTYENVERLPSYGENVVAIVIIDEWCRIPKYCHKVKAVFKCYGTRLSLGCNPLLKPSYLNIMTLFNFMRVWGLGLTGRINYAFQKFKNWQYGTVKIAPIYDIPLGYHNQLELPIKAIEDRPYDVGFAGSIEQNELHSVFSLNYWLKSPKAIARRKMVSTIDSIALENPNIKFDLGINPNFGASSGSDVNNYCKRLMDTKICLVPRGTSWETYRFFEAIRYGCIIVTEALPSRWFYDDSPAIRVTDWSKLVDILDELIENPDLINKKHHESLHWWKTKCSEVAVADYISCQLNNAKQTV